MATRSTIALEFANGVVQQVYCHWDGYLDHHGLILFRSYDTPDKVNALLDLAKVKDTATKIGITDKSWKSRTENVARPEGAARRFERARTSTTIAVDESARLAPMIIAASSE